jgi:hypothetical protein
MNAVGPEAYAALSFLADVRKMKANATGSARWS